ncbi:hypothetical protein NQ317_005571 [Molorchus minor]|uniref:Uncharacterized protein n=1 Tax=Molorchus minor TaxID=1323400 RepID=A0ABQ9IX19_9CUCU|nr:hypothetical protein NQ317_005571 [Molorchus minor]
MSQHSSSKSSRWKGWTRPSFRSLNVVACQYAQNTITISDTKKIFCSEWFRLAKQRLMREQKHLRNDNDNSIQLT